MRSGAVAEKSGEDGHQGVLESGKLPEIAGSSFTGWVAPANWPTPLRAVAQDRPMPNVCSFADANRPSRVRTARS